MTDAFFEKCFNFLVVVTIVGAIAALAVPGIGLAVAVRFLDEILPKSVAPAKPGYPGVDPGPSPGDDYILIQTIEGGFIWMKIK